MPHIIITFDDNGNLSVDARCQHSEMLGALVALADMAVKHEPRGMDKAHVKTAVLSAVATKFWGKNAPLQLEETANTLLAIEAAKNPLSKFISPDRSNKGDQS